MMRNLLNPTRMACLLCLILFFQSCSKDADLLSDYVINRDQSIDIQKYVVNDEFFLKSSNSIVLDVLNNDRFNELGNVVISETSTPENGNVTINENNTLTYVPRVEVTEAEEFSDTFSYTTEAVNDDSSVSTETGSVTITNKGKLIWYSDFETDQWNLTGSGDNKWEYESNRGEPRVTNDARKGKRAVWLGDYNDNITRNELHRNRVSSWDEHWIGFSIKVKEAAENSRVYAQFRNMRPEGSPDYGGVNPVTLRQGPQGKMYFATSTDKKMVDEIQSSGASTGTENTYFNYKLDEWIDIVIHWELDPTDGFLEIWVNGEKIVDKTGTTTYRYANVSGIPYTGEIKHTIGVYWSSKNTPKGNVYFDEYRVWKGPGTYEDVVPGRD
ncbi:heparin lyase I family protein [Maribacter sp. 4G9]|uniref:heparin lyase I family protein n=1 Tax=Maribacter sp. 4G9 TaxID=1889777 RepID=UPI000C14744B|nr:heparin lyase I family protein [Maribacter sp. 4G9]PIB23017.1 hypothetical protein BFP75_10975 [Maribacter sp. 4G9]